MDTLSQFDRSDRGANLSDLHVRETVRSAEQELRELLRQKAEMTRRICTIRQTLSGLADLFGDPVLGEDLLTLLDRNPVPRRSGFTNACRRILMEARGALTVLQICSQMRVQFPGLVDRHKDPLASLTTVLNRLNSYGEVQSLVNERGRRVWQWAASKEIVSGLPPVTAFCPSASVVTEDGAPESPGD